MISQENGKVSSQPEAKTSGKIEDINTISSILYDNLPKMTIAISLRSSKVLDESVFKNNTNQEKQADDLAQQNNDDTKDTTAATYKPTIPLTFKEYKY